MFLKYMTTRYTEQKPKNLVPPFKCAFLKEHYNDWDPTLIYYFLSYIKVHAIESNPFGSPTKMTQITLHTFYEKPNCFNCLLLANRSRHWSEELAAILQDKTIFTTRVAKAPLTSALCGNQLAGI